MRAMLTFRALALGATMAVGFRAHGVRAQLPTPKPPDTVFLEELTWDELASLIKAGKTTAIIATAGTEQKGPHMAIAEHKYAIEYTADKIARALGNAIVAPVVTYVPEGSWERPTGHMSKAGSITLPEERFRTLLELVARSLRGSGFKDIILIGDSGGNQAGMRFVADKLNADSSFKNAGVRLHFIGDYYAKAHAAQEAWLADTLKIMPRAEIGGHANIMDTSELLYIHAELVHPDRYAIANQANGVSGDPSKSSKEIGKKLLDVKIALALAEIRESMGQTGPGVALAGAPVPAPRASLLAAPYTEAMTWTDIRAAIDGGKKVIIIPTGGVEQNGPHMTLGKHDDIVTFAAGVLAQQLNGLVAPTVKWVPEGNNPDVVQKQPGTITNPELPYESLLDAAVRSERVHGFTDMVLIGDSGGNQRGLTAVADSLNKEWAGTGTHVFALTDYYQKGHANIYTWLEQDYGWNRQVVGSHAGIMDTSQLLYVNPAAVRTTQILPSGGGPGSGVNGDPTKATAELGKRMIDSKVSAAVAQYTALKGTR